MAKSFLRVRGAHYRRGAVALCVLLSATIVPSLLAGTPASASTSIAAVGSFDSSGGTGVTTLSVSPVSEGDALIVSVWELSSTATVSSVSGGGATTWTRLDQFDNTYPSDEELWMGQVTSGGPSTVALEFSSSVLGDYVEISAQEFTAGLGPNTVWTKDQSAAQNNASSTSIPLPNLTPSASSELYVGYGESETIAGAGSSAGFTYQETTGFNAFAYETDVSSSVSPTATQSLAGDSFSLAALVSAASPSVASGPTNPIVGPPACSEPIDNSSTTGAYAIYSPYSNFNWAALVLEDGGWAPSTNNIDFITDWMSHENRPSNWWGGSKNNPLNNGAGPAGGGRGLGSYPDLVTAAYWVAENLDTCRDGYLSVVNDLEGSAPSSTTASAIIASGWSCSHYSLQNESGSHFCGSPPVGYGPDGSAWTTVAVPSLCSAPGAVWASPSGEGSESPSA